MNSGLSEAPPTKNPSISGCLAKSFELAPVTEPKQNYLNKRR